jgi:hypothetical protein
VCSCCNFVEEKHGEESNLFRLRRCLGTSLRTMKNSL